MVKKLTNFLVIFPVPNILTLGFLPAESSKTPFSTSVCGVTESPFEKLDADLLLQAAHIVCPHWGKQLEVPATTCELFAVLLAAVEAKEKSTNASGQEPAAGDKENEPEPMQQQQPSKRKIIFF